MIKILKKTLLNKDK